MSINSDNEAAKNLAGGGVVALILLSVFVWGFYQGNTSSDKYILSTKPFAIGQKVVSCNLRHDYELDKKKIDDDMNLLLTGDIQ